MDFLQNVVYCAYFMRYSDLVRVGLIIQVLYTCMFIA